jgi:putative aminopeptidase FrvX
VQQTQSCLEGRVQGVSTGLLGLLVRALHSHNRVATVRAVQATAQVYFLPWMARGPSHLQL